MTNHTEPDAPAAPRVIHFVTGGFSGATQVAIDLVRAARSSGQTEPLLVLRKKRQTDPARVAQLRAEGIAVEVLPGWSHAATIWALRQLCLRFKPQALLAHGFPEHIIGRYSGLWAGVPALLHVEHNSRERYSRVRLAQTRWLAQRSARIVGCSEGVKKSLLALGMPADRTVAIPNGIRLEPFAAAADHPYAARTPGIVMSARFARQKDHATLLQALALLKQRGLTPPLLLAGGGKASHRRQAEDLARQLGLGTQVQFLGFCKNMPELLMTHQVCVLSTHYEGMPLSLVEGMAAGCAVIGSDVDGVRELIDHERNGLLVAHASAPALADALEALLRRPETAAALATQARADAVARHSLTLMTQRYEQLIHTIIAPANAANAPRKVAHG